MQSIWKRDGIWLQFPFFFPPKNENKQIKSLIQDNGFKRLFKKVNIKKHNS